MTGTRVTAAALVLALWLALPQAALAQGGAASGLRPAAPPAADFARWLTDPARCAAHHAPTPEDWVHLDTAVRAVVCNTAVVRQGPGLAAQAQAALDRAQAARQPALSVSLGADRVRASGSSATAGLQLDWLLLDFGATDASQRQARLNLQAVFDTQDAEALAAVAQAARLYTLAQSALGRLEAAAVNLRSAQSNAQVASARQQGGAATLADKLQAETGVAQARLEHARALSQWMSARGTLALAMGLPASQPLRLSRLAPAEAATAEPAPDVQALIDEARQQHPLVRAAQGRVAALQARAEGLAAQRWGSVSISARAAHDRAAGRLASGGQATTASAGIEWSVPLFDRGVRASQQREVGAQLQQREIDVQEAERLVAQQVWQEAQALAGELAGVAASRELLETTETSLRVASERFRQGAGSFTDVLAAQNAAAAARFQWVDARANLARARWRLAAAVGRFGAL